jgi:hypothetical protein
MKLFKIKRLNIQNEKVDVVLIFAKNALLAKLKAEQQFIHEAVQIVEYEDKNYQPMTKDYAHLVDYV